MDEYHFFADLLSTWRLMNDDKQPVYGLRQSGDAQCRRQACADTAGGVRMQVNGQNGPNATVTIYMSGTYRLYVFDRYAGRQVYRSGPCVSNGHLEKRIFAFLDS